MTDTTAVVDEQRTGSFAADRDDSPSGRRLSAIGLPVAGAIVMIGLWWAAVDVFQVRSFFVPSPWDIVESFGRLPGYLLRETWTTLLETLAGFALALVIGLAISIVLTSFETLRRATLPLLVALNSIPKVAVAPLLAVWLGFGREPKIVMVVLISFFPIVISTMAGIASTPADLGELTRSLSASRTQAFVKVRIPWALPQIFVGMKVAITLSVIGTVVAEISSPQIGLGSVVVNAGTNADTPLAFAAITLLAVMSVVLYYLVAGLERLLLPWAKAISG
jgi:NitT/TauT family transport system permease protein